MDKVTESSNTLCIRSSWEIPVQRSAVYAIASDFLQMPKNFPRIAKSIKLLSRDGNRLRLEAEAASFGSLFPRVIVTIDAELIPNQGYRCSTFNRTFNTRGEESLLLRDTAAGTQIDYTYTVIVKRGWLRPLYGWLVRTFGLPYWKRSYLAPLTECARKHQHATAP